MRSQYQILENPSSTPFQNVYNYINEQADSVGFLLPQIQSLETRLMADLKRKHLNDEKINAMSRTLLDVVKSTYEMDSRAVQTHINTLKRQCSYSRAIKSKWTLIGCAIGALIESVAMTIVIVATKGAGIPLCAVALNISSSSCIGALLGHKVGQYKARKNISSVGNSIFNLFKEKGLRPTKSSREFSTDEKLIPKTKIEVANKLAAIHYQNLILTVDDIQTVLNNFLEETKQDVSVLNEKFISDLLNTKLELNKYCLKTLLTHESDLAKAVSLLSQSKSNTSSIELAAI